jgi:hypothetical protein
VAAIEKTAAPPEANGGQANGGQASREQASREPNPAHARPPRLVPATVRTVRAHWLFTFVFAAGLGLRVLAEVAYRPALLYIDSVKYLTGSESEPEGYGVLLRLLDPVGGLGLVAAAQHVLGLAMAVTGYALLIRRGVPRWLAALAVAPVLLDAYQLQLEQTIMPDVLFEAMITAGLVLLLWRRQPGPGLVAAAGVVLGGAAAVREIGAVLLVPGVVFALLTLPGQRTGDRWRRRAGAVALAGGCFALPLLGYLAAAYAATGHFGLASNGPAPEYGRVAAAADCATLKLPADERALCPSPALTLVLGGVDGLLHNARSPGLIVKVPAGTTHEKLLSSFSLAVLRQQPLPVAAAITSDSVRLFALTRDGDPEVTSISRWQFQTFYPAYPPGSTMALFTQLTRENGGELVAVKPIATVLRDYQLHGGYTPGPLYAFALAAGLAGALSGLVRRRTDKELAGACLLVTFSAVILLVSSDAFEFSWRYQLPVVIMLPLAGALGCTAVAARLTAVRTATGDTGPRTHPASAGSGLRAPGAR